MFSWIFFLYLFLWENTLNDLPSHTGLAGTKILLQKYFLVYLFIGVYMVCHGLDVNWPPWSHVFEYLVPSWWQDGEAVVPLKMELWWRESVSLGALLGLSHPQTPSKFSVLFGSSRCEPTTPASQIAVETRTLQLVQLEAFSFLEVLQHLDRHEAGK